MAWIKMIEEAEAEGLLAELYHDAKRLKRPYPVAHIKKIHSLNPEAMQHVVGLDRKIRRGQSPLTILQREMIATVVSALNNCHY